MVNRESGDYRRNRDRDEFRGSEFRGGAEESSGRGYEERNRGMQFGREREESGRGYERQAGSQGYRSPGYGQSPQWQSRGSYETSGRGFSGESGGYGSPEYGPQTFGSSPRYGSQDYGSEGYRYPSGSQFQNRPGRESFGRGSEGIDRSQGFSTGQSYDGRFDQEFESGTSPYGTGSQRFRGTQGFGQTGYSGYSEGQFGTPASTRGRYTGRGPKGYTRSDERIKEDVNDRLEQHGDIDAYEIVVMVQNGEVTLEGTVPDRRTKRLAEDVAEESPGVKQVHNRLRLQGDGGEREIRGSTGASSTSRLTEESDRSRSGSPSKSSSRT